MNKAFFTFLLLLCAWQMQAQQITVYSSPALHKNKPAYLYIPNDLIDFNAILLDSSAYNAGTYTFKATTNRITYAFIEIGDISYDLYLEPGKDVTLYLNDTTGHAQDTLFKPVSYNPKTQAGSDLNTTITDFDVEFNYFMLANSKAILRKTAQKQAEEFIKKLKEKYKIGTQPGYANDYMVHRMAALELSAYIKSKKTIITEYFNNKPVLYNNMGYIDLFVQVFEDELSKFSLTNKGKDILTAINVNIDYTKAIDIMKRDTVLKNDTLRELYLIKGLGELYYNPQMVKYSVLEMLEYISKNGLTADNKLIAQHSLMKLDKLRAGTPAPPFTLKNIVSGEQQSLKDFEGKLVYLSFWDEDNVPAVQEIDLIRELEKEFGRKVAFISICNCPNETKTKAFINRNKYKWVFLNANGNKQLLDDYLVLSYPAFYLIDAKGNILKYPADKPSGRIGGTINSLINSK